MNKKPILFGILCLLLTVTFFCLPGCGGETEPAETGTETESGTVYEEPTDPKLTELAGLLRGHLSEYQLVRSDTMKKDTVNVILSFRQALSHFSDGIVMVTDFEYSFPRMEKEIVVGKTNLEGKYYTVPVAALSLGEGEFSVDVVGERIILSYVDSVGMREGLEYLLLAAGNGSATEMRNAFSDALQANGWNRFDHFTLRNGFCDGMKLAAKDLLCFGTSEKGSTVSVCQYAGESLLRKTDAKTGADGAWSMEVPPETAATVLTVEVNGTRVKKYTDISYIESVYQNPKNDIAVFINGTERKALVSDSGSLVIASLGAGESRMEVVIRHTHRTVDIRPLHEEIAAVDSTDEVKFTVESFPKKLTVEFDGTASFSVQLFLYGEETTDPASLDNVRYYAPGEYTVDGYLNLTDGQTVYLAEGAVLHTHVRAANAKNISILGRGVIDTFPFSNEENMIVLSKCENVTLRDFTLIGPRKWMVDLEECTDCTVRALNILGTKMNSDGVDIVGSQNVTVEGCYLRCNDDCIAIKSHGRDVKNLRIRGNVFYNDVYGNAMELGYETVCQNISDVVFEDNDVIHSLGGAIFSIHLGDGAAVSDVTYRDNRVEECEKKLIEIFIKETQYTKDTVRGTISNVTFDGIDVTADYFGTISITGYDTTHDVNGVTFRNVTYLGKSVTADKANIKKNNYVKGITWDGAAVN